MNGKVGADENVEESGYMKNDNFPSRKCAGNGSERDWRTVTPSLLR